MQLRNPNGAWLPGPALFERELSRPQGDGAARVCVFWSRNSDEHVGLDKVDTQNLETLLEKVGATLPALYVLPVQFFIFLLLFWMRLCVYT